MVNRKELVKKVLAGIPFSCEEKRYLKGIKDSIAKAPIAPEFENRLNDLFRKGQSTDSKTT